MAGLLFFGFAVLMMSDDGFLGSRELYRNAPVEVAKALLILGVLYVFVSVALWVDPTTPTPSARPYPTSDDLFAAMLDEAPPKARAKVRALFEVVEAPVGIGFAPAAKPSELK